MAELFIDCGEEGFEKELIETYAAAFVESDVPLSCEVVFESEEGIRNLNAATRGKDSVTDVLSFPNLDGIRGKALKKEDYPYDLDEEERLFLGSIVICKKRAEEQAEEYGHSLRREICYLAVHGICHLLGYDHETEEDKSEMRAKEEEILSAMGVKREA